MTCSVKPDQRERLKRAIRAGFHDYNLSAARELIDKIADRVEAALAVSDDESAP